MIQIWKNLTFDFRLCHENVGRIYNFQQSQFLQPYDFLLEC